MLRTNRRHNTLERELYRYVLQDVAEPRLFREVFPYNQPPAIPFNHRIVPMTVPDEIWITDTTFRDGQQSRPPFTIQQVSHLYNLLHRLGGSKGKIQGSEFFLYTERDKQAVAACLDQGHKYPEVTGWIRGVIEDFALVKQMGLRETGILTSVSDYHISLKLKKTRREAIDTYKRVVEAALSEGIVPRCHLEDITRADYYGFVVPFVQELMELSEQAGRPIKLRLCDTLGYGVTYPGASMPRSVKGLVYGLVHHAGVPSEQLEWHGHNDFFKAVTNATTAWLYGCCAANGTLLGIGERTGNTSIEALVFEYMGLRGQADGMDPTAITEIADYFVRDIGYDIPVNQPFVGRDFNLTRAGIHADGLAKDEEIYNIFDTRGLLNRPPAVAITDKSGAAGISHWIEAQLRRKVDKSHAGIARIREAIEAEYESGRTTAISDQEMAQWVARYMPELAASADPE